MGRQKRSFVACGTLRFCYLDPSPAPAGLGYSRKLWRRCGAAQELRNFVLHGFEFVEPQLRILHNENIAGGGVFVNQDEAVFRLFAFDLL